MDDGHESDGDSYQNALDRVKPRLRNEQSSDSEVEGVETRASKASPRKRVASKKKLPISKNKKSKGPKTATPPKHAPTKTAAATPAAAMPPLYGSPEGGMGLLPLPPFPNEVGVARLPQFSPTQIGQAASAAANVISTPRAPTAVEDMQKKPSAKKKSPPGTTTARKLQQKEQKKIRIGPGKRVFVKRKTLYLLAKAEQQVCMKDKPDNYRLYGTVNCRKGKSTYSIRFDEFPALHKELSLTRPRIGLVQHGEEETPDPNPEDDYDVLEEGPKKKKKLTPAEQSMKEFVDLGEDILRDTPQFRYVWGTNPDEHIDWKIFGDMEYITEEDGSPMQYPEELSLKKEIDFRMGAEDNNLSEVFFEHFFPSVEGHAKLMDKFNQNFKSDYHQTYLKEKMTFYDAEAEDPDWIIKQCYLLLLAGVCEADVGVDNLWKKGKSGGRRMYADFGRYLPKNMFKVFLSCAAFMFCDEQYWYIDKRDLGWEVFEPCLNGMNEKRKELFEVVLLMLDESMSGWKPKTSKYGGLPNITSEPRKPVDLGTQLKNGVECLSGVLAYQDIVAAPEKQRKKGYYFSDNDLEIPARSSLPNSPEVQAHVAETLRQVNGAKVRAGGWVGGDAWFGSVMSSVELINQLGVTSTFIVKNNQLLFPKKVLHAILKARHGVRPAGHWVTMSATISGVTVVIIAYAWSQKGVSYFVTTTGSTEPSEFLYECKFEDEWGNTNSRAIKRPKLVHFLYEYAPLIDEHNKGRQQVLNLEKRWLTKSCWFRLTSTVLGQCVVDMHRYFRYHEIRHLGSSNQKDMDLLLLVKFTDLICGNLREWQYKAQRKVVNMSSNPEEVLERIVENGTMYMQPSPSQLKNGLQGNPIVQSCFVCRRYMMESGKNRQQKTSFRCKHCHTPLCRLNRIGENGGREHSCVEEHCTGDNDFFLCGKSHRKGSAVPLEHVIDLYPRRSVRNKKT